MFPNSFIAVPYRGTAVSHDDLWVSVPFHCFSSDAIESYIKASYATFNEKALEVVNNFPIGDAVRTRQALNYKEREELFIENTAGGEDLGTQEML